VATPKAKQFESKVLPFNPPVAPMLGKLAREMPEGDFIFEPKWDGFRSIVFIDQEVELSSRNERPLTRYFPELVRELQTQLKKPCVLDGEIVIVTNDGLDFEALLQRIHPAASRIEKLAHETPASFVAFDVLAIEAEDLRAFPLHERRARLEGLLAAVKPPLYLTPATRERSLSLAWFQRFEGAGLDGVIAKPVDVAYLENKREMFKVKHQRTADCVVGGFRIHKDGEGVGSLLLGLHDAQGVLHHVGVASSFSVAQRKQLRAELEPLRLKNAEHPWVSPEYAGDAMRLPGGESRWTGDRDLRWEPLRLELVAEVAYDHLQGSRFRHATRLLRFRPDRTPASCTYEQLESTAPFAMSDIFANSSGD